MVPLNPRAVSPPREGVWRVARGPNPLDARLPDPDTLTTSKAGNRFDAPNREFGVLYFGSTLKACFGETLARKRPDPTLARLVEQEWQGRNFMEIGAVPQDWRDRRSAVRVRLPADIPYLDVEHPDTHQFLRRELALGLSALGHGDLNIGTVRGPDRRVTRLISHWAWSQGEPTGRPSYAGIRYVSKINNDWECWAVFWDAQFEVLDTKPITLDMPDLQEMANFLGLRIH
ncbi:MAG: RES family NAD+ phosphorylase [Acidimicrobiales bacterium]